MNRYENRRGGDMFNGNLLKVIRKERGFTLEKLAKKVASSKSYMWELENNRSVPSANILYGISKALRTRMERFFD